MYFNIYAIPIYITLIFLSFIFFISLKNRQSKHMYYFVLFNFVSAVYTLFYSLEISTYNVDLADVFYKLEYLGIPYVTVFFLLFVLKFTGKKKIFNKNLTFLIFLIPIITTIIAITNDYHHFHLRDFNLVNTGLFPIVAFNPSIGYWVSQFFYLVTMTAALGLLIQHKKTSNFNQKKQINILLFSSIIPFIFWLIYLVKLMPFGLDPVPFSFLFSSVLIFLGLSKNSLLQSDFVLRNALFEKIGSSVILTDSTNKVSDFNEAAEENIYLSRSSIGLSAETELFFWKNISIQNKNHSFNATNQLNGKTYKVIQTALINITQEKIGNMFILTDITKNIQTDASLKTSEESFKDIIDNASDIIQSVDKNGNFNFVNNAWKNLLGYEDLEIENMTMWDIIDDNCLNSCKNIFKDVLEGNCANNIETVFKTKDGRKLTVEGNINCRYENGELKGTRGIFRDITERIKIETQLKNKQKLLAAIALSTDELLKNKDYNEALPKIFDYLGNATGVDRIYLFENEFDANGNATRKCSQKIEWCSSEVLPQIKNQELQNLPFDAIIEVIIPLENFRDLNISVKNIKDEVTKKILASQNILSMMLIPLRVDDKFWGFIGFDDCETERKWSTEEFTILQSFTVSVSYAIERKIILEKLNQSVVIAEKSSMAKGEFVANMSHEIRTPLNGVIGFSDLLIKTNLEETQMQYAKSINQSATSLLDIINDILDFSKIEAGKLDLNYEILDLHSIIDQITNIVKFSAHQKNLKILTSIQDDVPNFVLTDYVRIRQILINLLSNAIKFTKKGEIEIKIEATPTSNIDESIFRFSIRDTGIGIEENMHKKIFESFTQADSTITKKYGGSGLGLSIVTRLLKIMGSELMLESELGKGSTFWFELILKSTESNPEENYDIGKLKVFNKTLIVDTNKNNQDIFVDMLKIFGIESTIVDNAVSALEVINKESPTLAIIDYNIRDKNGLELISEIRHNLEINSSQLPIIFSHSSVDANIISDLILKKEINTDIIKPIKLTQLKQSLLSIYNELFNNTIEEETHIAKNENEESHILEKIKILIAEDNPTNMLLAKYMISAVIPEAQIIGAVDGLDAVELFNTHTPDLIFMDIHMPNMSGYDATKLIRQTKKGKDVPIIALTAGVLAEEKEKSIEYEMNDFVTKPIVISQIKAIIDKYINIT